MNISALNQDIEKSPKHGAFIGKSSYKGHALGAGTFIPIYLNDVPFWKIVHFFTKNVRYIIRNGGSYLVKTGF